MHKKCPNRRDQYAVQRVLTSITTHTASVTGHRSPVASVWIQLYNLLARGGLSDLAHRQHLAPPPLALLEDCHCDRCAGGMK
jgi:hypothetical protein